MTLGNSVCSAGKAGSVGGCTLAQFDCGYRVAIEPLLSEAGVTVAGEVIARSEPSLPDVPPVVARRNDRTLASSASFGILGLLSGAGVFLWARRRGRNQVSPGGATDSAFASNASVANVPNPSAPQAPALIADGRLDELATTEFTAPTGLRPWHGAALLREGVDDQVVASWFSDLIADGVLELNAAQVLIWHTDRSAANAVHPGVQRCAGGGHAGRRWGHPGRGGLLVLSAFGA